MLDIQLQLFNSLESSFRILRFLKRHTFSMKSRLGSRQASLVPIPLLRSHTVVACAECGLASTCWSKQGHSFLACVARKWLTQAQLRLLRPSTIVHH